MINRREWLQGLAALLSGCATKGVLSARPSAGVPRPLSPLGKPEERAVFVEFAEVYRKKYWHLKETGWREVNVLYPGSGSDLSPLEMGLQLLHSSEVQEVRFLYTEIGEYKEDLPAWHEGIASLDQQLQAGLQQLVTANLAEHFQRSHSYKDFIYLRNRYYMRDRYTKELRKPSPSTPRLITYTLVIPVGNQSKRLALTLSYNYFEDRREPTVEEKAAFTPELLQGARNNYWPLPRRPGEIYPTYFLQEQFDEADILLSKQCGDFGLLQFDYVRALRNTKLRKPRVILTEHADKLPAVQQSLSPYRTEVVLLGNNRYGYCESENNCQVGILAVQEQ